VLIVTEYIFLFGLGGTLVSVYSTLAHQDEESGDKSYSRLSSARKEVAGFQNVMLLPLCIFIFVFIQPISFVVFGDKFAPAIAMVRAGLGALFISVGVFGGGMQITTLISIGKERLVFRIRLFWGILNFVTNLVLIYYFGAMGAIVGTVYSNCGACGTEWYFATRYVGNSMHYLSTARIAVISIAAAVIPYVMIELFFSGLSSLVQIMIAGMMDGLLVIALYSVFRIPELGILRKRFGNLMGTHN
jgi:O-antigen/teichoic acid export membrane protein